MTTNKFSINIYNLFTVALPNVFTTDIGIQFVATNSHKTHVWYLRI